MEKIVIIGANEFQKKLVDKANLMGFETHVFSWEEGAVAKSAADYFYPVSITEKEKIYEIVKSIKPMGICSISSDLAMHTVNYVAEKLGLVGNSVFCTDVTTDKYKMRNILSTQGLPCPKYASIKNSDQLDKINMSFPLITKPVDRSGSRGIYKVQNMNELKTAVKKSMEVSFNKEVIVEEFIEGKEYSVEFVSQKGEHNFLQITEKFTTGSPNFIEKGHLSPAKITEENQEKIIRIIRGSLDALMIKNGASHSEIKITPNNEIKIIEIAGRMGGDFIGSDMVYISTGFDFTKSVIDIAINKKLETFETYENNFAFVGFIFKQEDVDKFSKVQLKYPHIIQEYHINQITSDVYDSSTRNGYFILNISSKEELNAVLTIFNLEDHYDFF